MSDAAENVDNTQEETQESIAQSSVSFDELDTRQAFSERSQELSVAPKPEKEVPKNAVEALKQANEEEPKEELPEVKLFKIKNGLEDLSLRADTKVPVKIDGEVQEVPFEQLLSGYSGTEAVQKRFTEYSQAKQKFDSEKKEVDDFLNEIISSGKEDPLKGLLVAAERMGLDPIQYQMSLMENLAQHTDKWGKMSEVDRKLYRTQLENEQLKKAQERTTTQMETEKQNQEVLGKVETVMKDIGVDLDQFKESYGELEDLWRQGLFKGEITPEIVADYIQDKRKVETAEEILSSVDKDLVNDEKLRDNLIDIMYDNPSLGVDDIKEVVKKHFVENISKKASKKMSKGKPGQVEPRRTPINAGQVLTSFDQLEGY